MRKHLFYSGIFSILITLFNLTLAAQNTAPYWSLAGNSTASNTTSKLGTTNAINLRLFTNNLERVHINASNGYVGLGTTAPTQRLHVVGNALITGNVGIGTTSLTYRLNVASTTNHAIYGTTTASGKAGVYGNGSTYGVYGNSTNGYGIYGRSTNFYGGYFNSTNSDGVDALSSNGYYGVYASSGNPSGYGVVSYGGYIGTYGSGGTYGAEGYSYGGNAGVYGDGFNAEGGSFHSTNNWALQARTDNGFYAGVFYGAVWTSDSYNTSDKNLKKNIKEFDNALSIIRQLKPRNYEFRDDAKFASLNLPKGTHYGLIAQDLEDILPNLVHEEKFTVPVKTEAIVLKPKTAEGKDENQYDKIAAPAKTESMDIKAVNYTELIPIMVKALQEMNNKNEELEKKNNELEARLKKLEDLVAKNVLDGNHYDLNAASLEQNTPNPFNTATIIHYYLPQTAANAKVVITDASGRIVKSISLTGRGTGEINMNSGTLAAGSYNYTMWMDGKQVDSKKMVITR